MSGEDFQRQMDFMLMQQAKFNEDMIKLDEMTRENREDIKKLVGAVMNLTLHSQDHDQRIAALIEHGKETDRRIAELAASGKETDGRLNVLISVIERHISDGHAH